jgi:hypothetical protein
MPERPARFGAKIPSNKGIFEISIDLRRSSARELPEF